MKQYKTVFSSDKKEQGNLLFDLTSDFSIMHNVKGSYDYLYHGICFAQRVGKPTKKSADELINNALLGIGPMSGWTHENLNKAIDMAKEKELNHV